METIRNLSEKLTGRRQKAAKSVSNLIQASREVGGPYIVEATPEKVREVDELSKVGIEKVKELLSGRLNGPDQAPDVNGDYVKHTYSNVTARQTMDNLSIRYAHIVSGISLKDGKPYDIGADMEYVTITNSENSTELELEYGIENDRMDRLSGLALSKKDQDGHVTFRQSADLARPIRKQSGIDTYRLTIRDMTDRLPASPQQSYEVATSVKEENTAAILETLTAAAHQVLEQLDQQSHSA